MRLLLRDRTKIALRCTEIECASSFHTSAHERGSERANCNSSPAELHSFLFSHATERARELVARLAHLRLSELLTLGRRARLERLLSLRAQRVELHEQC